MIMKPVRLVIRDDDASFFTKPKDLEKVYSVIPDFPVSFAVVPFIVAAGKYPDTKGNKIPRPVSDNKELIGFLSERYKEGKCDILLHGITHEYHYLNGKKVSEMIWREHEEPNCLKEKILEGKKELETAFRTEINCFAAPHNDIGKLGVQALYSYGMHYSGIIPISYLRDLSLRAVRNYVKRFWIRYYKGFQYPGILNYGTHLELNACVAGNDEYLNKIYQYCKEIEAPMAINVHYWDIREKPYKYRNFFDFINYAIKDGAVPSRMRDVLNQEECILHGKIQDITK